MATTPNCISRMPLTKQAQGAGLKTIRFTIRRQTLAMEQSFTCWSPTKTATHYRTYRCQPSNKFHCNPLRFRQPGSSTEKPQTQQTNHRHINLSPHWGRGIPPQSHWLSQRALELYIHRHHNNRRNNFRIFRLWKKLQRHIYSQLRQPMAQLMYKLAHSMMRQLEFKWCQHIHIR